MAKKKKAKKTRRTAKAKKGKTAAVNSAKKAASASVGKTAVDADEELRLTQLRSTMSRAAERLLAFTAEHGNFGLNVVDALHEQLPPTRCKACGACCFSIFFYSLEYHRIVQCLAANFTVSEIRRIVYKVYNPEPRMRVVEGDTRYRCLFLTDGGLCRIYPVRPFICRVFGQEIDGRQECSHVKTERPIGSDFVENLAARVASASEQFRIPTPDGDETVDFFPLEFWIRRAVEGKEAALAWFLESPFYDKYLRHRRVLAWSSPDAEGSAPAPDEA